LKPTSFEREYGFEREQKRSVPILDGSAVGKESENACFLRLVTKSIESTIATDRRFCRWGSKCNGDHLVNVLLDYKEGVSKPAIMKHAKTYLREYLFGMSASMILIIVHPLDSFNLIFAFYGK
jgi:hypothetical protein